MKYNSLIRLPIFMLALTGAVWSCKSDTQEPKPAATSGNTGTGGSSSGGSAAQTGTATFFTKVDLGVGAVTVYVDGKAEGTISHYHTNGVTCGQGDVNATRPAGTYSFKATGGTQVWEGTVTIKNGACQAQELVKSTTGGGNSGGGNTTGQGQAMVWTAAASGWSSIDVSVGGVYAGTISKYYATAPNCGAAGCVTISKAPGTYAFTAKTDQGGTTSGNLTITANVCTTNQLTFAPTGGSTTTCDWTAWNKLVTVTRYEYDPKGSYCANNTGITYLEVMNKANEGMTIDFCFKKTDGTWYCANVATGANSLMKTNICAKTTDLRIQARPYGKDSPCPFWRP